MIISWSIECDSRSCRFSHWILVLLLWSLIFGGTLVFGISSCCKISLSAKYTCWLSSANATVLLLLILVCHVCYVSTLMLIQLLGRRLLLMLILISRKRRVFLLHGQHLLIMVELSSIWLYLVIYLTLSIFLSRFIDGDSHFKWLQGW